jgi:hypothetical protein
MPRTHREILGEAEADFLEALEDDDEQRVWEELEDDELLDKDERGEE